MTAIEGRILSRPFRMPPMEHYAYSGNNKKRAREGELPALRVGTHLILREYREAIDG